MATRPRLALAPSTKWRKPARPRHCCRTATSLAVKFSISKTTPAHPLPGICCARFMKISETLSWVHHCPGRGSQLLPSGGPVGRRSRGTWHPGLAHGTTPGAHSGSIPMWWGSCGRPATQLPSIRTPRFAGSKKRGANPLAERYSWKKWNPHLGRNLHLGSYKQKLCETQTWIHTKNYVRTKLGLIKITSLRVIPTVTSY